MRSAAFPLLTDGAPRRATYRLQLRGEFGFEQAATIVPYLDTLGISDLYLSPILQAAAGSTHGYDVVDHSRLSAELGGPTGLDHLAEVARGRALGLTVDIVPNHMAIDGQANRWWWDVLENGPASPYASYFDIDWQMPEPAVLVPVLADRYGRALERREVKVRRDGGSFLTVYGDHELPLSPRSQDDFLARAAEMVESAPLRVVAEAFGALPHARITDAVAVMIRHQDKEQLRDSLATLCDSEPKVASAIDQELERINQDPDELDRLLRRQNYRLAYWRVGREELDYRRFFNIETLVGLRAEEEQVFADTHELVARLVREGKVSGLRVDHVDGLRDPEGYLQRLRRLVPASYVAVEKILHPGEHLREEWPVQGTTGYDFIARVANVLVDQTGEELVSKCYANLTGESALYSEVARKAKLQIMTEELAPEMDRLARLLQGICENHRRQRDRTRREVHEALRAVLASFPLYRTYVQPDRARREEDVDHVRAAIQDAREAAPETDPELLEFIGELVLLDWPGQAEAEFAQTLPQVSAPVMAKGVEDTAFYRYNRLVSLNEVGGDPGVFGTPLADFHAATAESAQRAPESMLALATHDTKRSPDVRARISLLSEIAAEWEAEATSWMTMTDGHASSAGPDYNIRYLLFQTLVGAWPISRDRLLGYMEKAAKEAKVYTSWTDPDADYDYSLRKFVSDVLDDEVFVSRLEGFLHDQQIVEMGRATSLVQTTLLLTCPGIPDVYQGTETWDHSLVDPDNRRLVDFSRLESELQAGQAWEGDALSRHGPADPAKVWLTGRLLDHRRRHPQMYSNGVYLELPVSGGAAPQLIAFSRGSVLVLAGRHLRRLAGNWGDTRVELPPGRWHPLVGPEGPAAGGDWPGDSAVPVSVLLGHGPLAVLESSI
ncbi:MAG: malto-oligosyltrehalose synthase [Acidimicrobiales bacterium]|nr:malto-oligosyltrehalose synthase [Acidimicrobiales bacterium]